MALMQLMGDGGAWRSKEFYYIGNKRLLWLKLIPKYLPLMKSNTMNFSLLKMNFKIAGTTEKRKIFLKKKNNYLD